MLNSTPLGVQESRIEGQSPAVFSREQAPKATMSGWAHKVAEYSGQRQHPQDSQLPH